MFLFHKLTEEDQHNAIHYCMHIVVDDMLEDGVELEPFSDEDKKMKAALERVIGEAKIMPQETQFEFVVHHAEVGQMIFDIALDMARSAFYASDDEMVIHFESLRHDTVAEEVETLALEKPKEPENLLGVMEEINMLAKKNNALN